MHFFCMQLFPLKWKWRRWRWRPLSPLTLKAMKALDSTLLHLLYWKRNFQSESLDSRVPGCTDCIKNLCSDGHWKKEQCSFSVKKHLSWQNAEQKREYTCRILWLLLFFILFLVFLYLFPPKHSWSSFSVSLLIPINVH